ATSAIFLLSVSGFFAGFPLDAAPDAGFLVRVDRLAGEPRIDRWGEIATSARLVVPRPAVVELPPIDQPPLTIEEIEVRSARGLVCLGNLLRFIEAKRKSEVQAVGHFLEPVRRVIRIERRIIAADADDAKPCVPVVLSQL